jgi:hypothetical protein
MTREHNMKGTKMKKYLIGMALAMSAICVSPSFAFDSVKLCTGGESGNYYAAGKEIAKMAGSTLPIEVIATEGTIDNMNKIAAGECDAMIGQPDGPVWLQETNPMQSRNLKPAAALHREYLQVICNKDAGVDDLSDLEGGKSGKLIIGAPGSGSWLVWQNIVAQDSGYENVPVSTDSDVIALSALSGRDDGAACMIVAAGLRNGVMTEADNTYGDSLILVEANDKDFNDAVDLNGEKLYEYSKIPSKTYPASLQKGHWSGTDTITWNAKVYFSTSAFQSDQKRLKAFITASARAAINVKAAFGK